MFWLLHCNLTDGWWMYETAICVSMEPSKNLNTVSCYELIDYGCKQGCKTRCKCAAANFPCTVEEFESSSRLSVSCCNFISVHVMHLLSPAWALDFDFWTDSIQIFKWNNNKTHSNRRVRHFVWPSFSRPVHQSALIGLQSAPRAYSHSRFPRQNIVQELCESQGGRPGLSVLTSLLVSVDVKLYWTMLRHWSQLVPNMSTDIWGH